MKRHRKSATVPQLPLWFIVCLATVFSLLLLLIVLPRAAVSRAAHLTAGTVELRLEIADTNALRQRGLSGRESMPQSEGMLFVFPQPDIYPFWMNEMKFPLDIIWISQGVVVEMTTLNPPDAYTGEVPEYRPTVAADMVLELNAGQASAMGLKIGSVLRIEQ